MKKFIVSDLHGNGNIYDSIINFLENINKEEDVTLFINGDLIDRGEDSARMLIDVKDRVINNKSFPIVYLGGNHELMMYQDSLKIENGKGPECSIWPYYNGGKVTKSYLEKLVDIEEEFKIIDFISNLKIYHKFSEELNGKKIVLVHAASPKEVEDNCTLKIKDNNKEVEKLVWTRDDPYSLIKIRIGNKDYFTIIGHTPLNTKYGYKYYKDDNYLNIDGGCSGYVLGYQEYDHTPLTLIDSENNRLIILTFNNNNEIIYGNYFNGKSILMTEEELDKYRKYLNKDVKIKKYK